MGYHKSWRSAGLSCQGARTVVSGELAFGVYVNSRFAGSDGKILTSELPFCTFSCATLLPSELIATTTAVRTNFKRPGWVRPVGFPGSNPVDCRASMDSGLELSRCRFVIEAYCIGVNWVISVFWVIM